MATPQFFFESDLDSGVARFHQTKNRGSKQQQKQCAPCVMVYCGHICFHSGGTNGTQFVAQVYTLPAMVVTPGAWLPPSRSATPSTHHLHRSGEPGPSRLRSMVISHMVTGQ